MKKRTVVFAVLSVMVLSLALFALYYQASPISTVSAEPVYGKLPTVTPYATSIPGVSVRVLQKYAYSEILTSLVHGFEISVANFRIENDELKVDVCHQNPNNREWTIGEAIIQSGAEKLYVTSFSGLEMARTFSDGRREVVVFSTSLKPRVEENFKVVGGEDNYRCDTASFRVPPDMTLTHVQLTIEHIRANTREGEGCYENRETVQSILDAKGANIKIDCSKNDIEGGSASRFTVIEKPNTMSQEEAMKQVTTSFSESLIIKGPWVFQGKVTSIISSTPPYAPAEATSTETPLPASTATDVTVTETSLPTDLPIEKPLSVETVSPIP